MTGKLRSLGVWIGGAGLIAAVVIDTLAVIGRNLGTPIVGSIELIQAAVLVSGIVGLVLATAKDEHARVRIITERFPRWRRLFDLIGSAAMVLLFGALLAGSTWLAADLWTGHEQSELVGVPWAVLRLIANAGLTICLAMALAGLFRRARE